MTKFRRVVLVVLLLPWAIPVAIWGLILLLGILEALGHTASR